MKQINKSLDILRRIVRESANLKALDGHIEDHLNIAISETRDEADLLNEKLERAQNMILILVEQCREHSTNENAYAKCQCIFCGKNEHSINLDAAQNFALNS